MTPVDMPILHDPENGAIGDCFRCCIATLLDLPVNEVPHFAEKDWGKTKDYTWFADLTAWLATRGFAFFELGPIGDDHGKWFDGLAPSGFDVHHVVSGMSPRGFRHSVVARNGVTIHDPHPSRGGLSNGGEEGWMYGFLVKR